MDSKKDMDNRELENKKISDDELDKVSGGTDASQALEVNYTSPGALGYTLPGGDRDRPPRTR